MIKKINYYFKNIEIQTNIPYFIGNMREVFFMKKRYLKKTISPYKDEIYEYEDEGFKKLLNIIKEYSTLILSSAAFLALFLTYLYEFIHTSLLNVNTEYIQVDSGIIGYIFLFYLVL